MIPPGNSKGQKVNLNLCLCLVSETKLAAGDRLEVVGRIFSTGYDNPDHGYLN